MQQTSKNGLHMFGALSSDCKIPFALGGFTTALPINSKDLNAGTILYGVNVPVGGIYVKETLTQVNEIVDAWFTTHAGVAGRA